MSCCGYVLVILKFEVCLDEQYNQHNYKTCALNSYIISDNAIY